MIKNICFKLIGIGCIVSICAGAIGCTSGQDQEIKAVDVKPVTEQPTATSVPSVTATPVPVNMENTVDINEIDYYNSILQNTYAMYGDGSQYALYDLDKDGIQEMIITAGTSEADWNNFVYTVSNQAAVMMGSFGTTVSLYVAEDGNGLYAVHGHMGNETIYQITKNGTQLGIATLSQRELSETEDYYSNENEVPWLTINSGNTGESVSADQNTISSSSSPDYILPDSSSRIIDPSEFGDFSINDMQMAINEIYARHGRRFQDEGIQAYFDSKSWYSGTVEPDYFDESVLSDVERENIDTLSYWMQPELTNSNPSTVDKYDYGVDATESSGDSYENAGQGDMSGHPYKHLEGTYMNYDVGVSFSLTIYDQPAQSTEYPDTISVGRATINWNSDGSSGEFYLSTGINGDGCFIVSSSLGRGKTTMEFYDTGGGELSAAFTFNPEYDGIYYKQ